MPTPSLNRLFPQLQIAAKRGRFLPLSTPSTETGSVGEINAPEHKVYQIGAMRPQQTKPPHRRATHRTEIITPTADMQQDRAASLTSAGPDDTQRAVANNSRLSIS
jgi:hypothetical protein